MQADPKDNSYLEGKSLKLNLYAFRIEMQVGLAERNRGNPDEKLRYFIG